MLSHLDFIPVLTAPLRHVMPTSTNTYSFVYPDFSCLPITECFNALTTQYWFLLQTSIFPAW